MEDRSEIDKDDAMQVNAVLQGQSVAFAVLVERYGDAIFRFVCSRVHNRSIAEDLSQEVFVEAFKSLPRLREQCHFRPWIYQIARHRMLNYFNREKPHEMLPLETFGPKHPISKQTPEKELHRKERYELLEQCLQDLPAELSEALTLYSLEEWSYEAIAELQQIPLGTVRSRLHRARALVRKQWEAYIK